MPNISARPGARAVRLALAFATTLTVAGLAVGPAAASTSTSAGTATGTIRISGNAHGFAITSTHANSNGTVTAMARDSHGRQFAYTGSPGATISLSMRVPKGSKTGQAIPMIGVTSDPAVEAKQVAAAKAALASSKAAVKPAATYEGSWCITYNDGSIGWEKSCDIRYLLASGYLIADEMETWAQSYGTYNLTYADIENDYTSTGGRVVKVEPSGSMSTGCSTSTISFTLYGLGFTTSFDSCSGTIYPYGLASEYGGSYYSGSTKSEIVMEPTLEVSDSIANPTFTTWFGINSDEYGVTW